jgi:DNA-binding winged helix-turn-helix (wHTH) protein
VRKAVDGVLALGEEQFVDLSSGVVSGPGGEARLEARLARLLNELVSARGAVVGRDALIEGVWMGRPVGDDAIDSAICRLRFALGDQRKQLIQTVPKRGYRFAGPARSANVDALCARGELALELWDSASTRLALSCFDAALGVSQGDARALAGAALSCAMLCLFGARPAPAELAIAAEQAQAAREAAPALGLMWVAVAAVRFLRDCEGAAAVDAADKAVTLLPATAMALRWRSQINLAIGRLDAAVEDAERAVRVDASNVGVRISRMAVLFMARRFAACCEAADHDLEEAGASLGLLAYKGWALMLMGKCDLAVDVMATSWRARPGRTEAIEELNSAYAAGGRAAYFGAAARLTSSDTPEDIVRPVDRAVLWAMAGEPERALAALHLAEQRGDLRLRWMAVMPQFDSLQPLKEFRT